MSDVPPTESIPKPEEPKAPAPAPQFQQVPPIYYQFPPQGYYPPQGFPNYPPLPMPYFPNPWMFMQNPAPAIPISIQIEERPRLRGRSEPLTQRVCHSSN
ncbi:hypothetical protein TVAG_070070 [Trichomonas vaginalis G3]|uniref:Uncharacterized protein n=1 Tax=Trichomonas vaginalis (strain ATCC PRA-98 / G3) TaxID=412133 RepID=A2ESP8_TRIV3|nr:hypothetical protein TVAGG3_0221000 [Trichomonas vaginalis G3]EAY04357.1 hypothetical protein TVAG_070070 [Trichomonas vaginalis G3]KAI5551936.1 hypothetical protein TVAGG3_0221000 [Trichomonas vaginalis G3]|eukprot:XP_001316580.1 hypothetical protein [Trichomonas vaginalis G3]